MTPYDFHQMTGLKCDVALINLKGEFGMYLGTQFLGQRYLMDTICYFNIETDYQPLLQETFGDCAQIARVFLLYILRAYLFGNRGQTLSLTWLSLFHDFEGAQKANQGLVCLAYLCSSLITLSQGTLHQLVGLGNSLRLVPSSFLLQLMYFHAYNYFHSYVIQVYRKLQIMLLQTAHICILQLLFNYFFWKLSSFKLYSFIWKIAFIHLANCTHSSCNLSF